MHQLQGKVGALRKHSAGLLRRTGRTAVYLKLVPFVLYSKIRLLQQMISPLLIQTGRSVEKDNDQTA